VAHGATPELWKCLKEFAARHSGIRLIPSEERLSHGVALNLALQASRGKYIVHMDSDDISSPERFEKIQEYFRSHPEVDIVGSFIEEFHPERGTLGVVEYPLGHEEISKAILRRNPVAHGSIAMRADQLGKVGMYVRYSIRNDDTLLWLNALKGGARFANIPEPLYRVRYARGNNLRRTGFKKSVSDLVDRLRIIIDLNGTWTDVLHAVGLCLVQNCPAALYQAIRASVVYRRA
jgi:glycosyltransferase involved in cell wall biosynthesis